MFGKAVHRIASSFGYDLTRRVPLADRADLDDIEKHVLREVNGYTLTSEARILALVRAVRYIARSAVPGALVECGVWRGGSMLAAALALRAEGDTARDLFLFDTFDGMSEPTEADRDLAGKSARELLDSTPKSSEVWCYADLADVTRTMAKANYPANRIHFVKGKVEATIPHADVGAIALLRLDTDWYESTAHEFKHLYAKLAVGGVLVIDDYGHWQGARKATDEFLSQQSTAPILLNTIDYTGRIAVKVWDSATSRIAHGHSQDGLTG
jgi:O-methyltransferase